MEKNILNKFVFGPEKILAMLGYLQTASRHIFEHVETTSKQLQNYFKTTSELFQDYATSRFLQDNFSSTPNTSLHCKRSTNPLETYLKISWNFLESPWNTLETSLKHFETLNTLETFLKHRWHFSGLDKTPRTLKENSFMTNKRTNGQTDKLSDNVTSWAAHRS